MVVRRSALASALGVVAFGLLLSILTPLEEDALARDGSVVRYVLDDGGVDVSGCADAQTPCRTIQYAMAIAEDGDTIQVGTSNTAAVYAGPVVITKSVMLEGGWGVVVDPHAGLLWSRPSPCEPSLTVIDGGQGSVIRITGPIAPVIGCFTITGGGAGTFGAGGGIYSWDASPVIVHNVITGNHAGAPPFASHLGPTTHWDGLGGGIYMRNAPATSVISGNLVSHNVGHGWGSGSGGGICLEQCDTQVLSNTIEHNQAGASGGRGGGLAVYNGEPEIVRVSTEVDRVGPVIADNVIAYNVASEADWGLGGGLHIVAETPVTVERNVIEWNHAVAGPGSPGVTTSGGGIYCEGSPAVRATIRHNIIRENIAALWPYSGKGGGIYLERAAATSLVQANTLLNNIASYNGDGYGGGLCVEESTVDINENHIVENKATWTGGAFGKGGGLHLSDSVALIEGNVISRNAGVGFPGMVITRPGFGGGIYAVGGETVVRGNLIAENTATKSQDEGRGGGICGKAATLVIDNNTIADNVAGPETFGGSGGGVYLGHSPGVLLTQNAIHGNFADKDGGGLWLSRSDGALVRRNRIYSNTASRRYGGGAYVADSRGVKLAQNAVLRNQAKCGGGLYLCARGGDARLLRLENALVAENKALLGGGVYVTGVDVDLLHATLALNGPGEGLYVSSGSADLTNTILVGHSIGLFVSEDSVVTLKATLWGDGGWGNAIDWDGPGVVSATPPNLHKDPGFADAAAGDFHLMAGSAAIGMGTPADVPEDIDGEPRLGGPDLGADEHVRLGFLPLVLRSGD